MRYELKENFDFFKLIGDDAEKSAIFYISLMLGTWFPIQDPEFEIESMSQQLLVVYFESVSLYKEQDIIEAAKKITDEIFSYGPES